VKVAQVINVDFALRHFLVPLMRGARERGHEVVGLCAEGPLLDLPRAEGFRIIAVPMARSLNPLAQLRAFLALLPKLDREQLLDLVLHAEPGDLDAPLTADDKARVLARIFPGEKFPEESEGARSIDAPTLRAYYAAIIDSDAFRILTGRLSMSYDGGQILD
jgi:hypothetical protein